MRRDLDGLAAVAAPDGVEDTTDAHALHLWNATHGLYEIGGDAWRMWRESVRLLPTEAKTAYRTALRTMCRHVHARRGIRITRSQPVPVRGSMRRVFYAPSYGPDVVGGFRSVADHATSTFPLDAETTSYTHMRRYLLRENRLPPEDAVRIEQLLNRFRFADRPPGPGDAHPIAASAEVAECPWLPDHRLCRIALAAATAARSVEVQLVFDPARVAEFRLLGSRRPVLRLEDRMGARDVEAGHRVCALYEIVPAPDAADGRLFRLRVRYGRPEGTVLEQDVTDTGATFAAASADLRWAAAVASFGMLLRRSEHRGVATWDDTLAMAVAAADAQDDRAEFVGMVRRARTLASARK